MDEEKIKRRLDRLQGNLRAVRAVPSQEQAEWDMAEEKARERSTWYTKLEKPLGFKRFTPPDRDPEPER
jgi:hypothetical protein